MNWWRKLFGPNPQLDPEQDDAERGYQQFYYQLRYKFFTTYPEGWIDASIEDGIVTVALRIDDDLEVTPLSQGMSGHPNTVRAQMQAFVMACIHIGLDLDIKTEAKPSDDLTKS